MSLQLFGYNSVREKIQAEKKWLENDFADCPYIYDPEASWLDNATICRLSILKPYCQHFGIDQLLNKEFNDALAQEISNLGLSPILEVNAGSGELTRAMRRRGIKMAAVDGGRRPRGDINHTQDLPESMSHGEALHQYQPQLVICSWMPQEVDMAQDFRSADSVMAYILIDEEQKIGWAEYAGWRSQVLIEPNKWSLCYLDYGIDFDQPQLYCRHAKVVIFSRL